MARFGSSGRSTTTSTPHSGQRTLPFGWTGVELNEARHLGQMRGDFGMVGFSGSGDKTEKQVLGDDPEPSHSFPTKRLYPSGGAPQRISPNEHSGRRLLKR